MQVLHQSCEFLCEGEAFEFGEFLCEEEAFVNLVSVQNPFEVKLSMSAIFVYILFYFDQYKGTISHTKVQCTISLLW